MKTLKEMIEEAIKVDDRVIKYRQKRGLVFVDLKDFAKMKTTALTTAYEIGSIQQDLMRMVSRIDNDATDWVAAYDTIQKRLMTLRHMNSMISSIETK